MKIILYPHGGSGNHGCEAIVRATKKILSAKKLTLFSSNMGEDVKYGLGEICMIKNEQRQLKRLSSRYIKAFVERHLLKEMDAFDKALFADIIEEGKKCDYALSIGGDNYCYGAPQFIYTINKALRKKGVKTILWGCSVEPSAIQGEMLNDLKGYTHIFARESITYDAMKERGIKNVTLLPDPAFQLERKDLPLPEGFAYGNTVGINISPMIIGNEKKNGVILQNYIELIKHILEKTDMQIALIPHVVWSHNDDRQPLRELYEYFKGNKRIVMIDDHNAEELKGYIARCRFMVAARTHASIAAYSEEVPTLVVGYSVKAGGIAKDIFGTEKGFVVSAQDMEDEKTLLEAFDSLYKREEDIINTFRRKMAEYKDSAKKAASTLGKL